MWIRSEIIPPLKDRLQLYVCVYDLYFIRVLIKALYETVCYQNVGHIKSWADCHTSRSQHDTGRIGYVCCLVIEGDVVQNMYTILRSR